MSTENIWSKVECKLKNLRTKNETKKTFLRAKNGHSLEKFYCFVAETTKKMSDYFVVSSEECGKPHK